MPRRRIGHAKRGERLSLEIMRQRFEAYVEFVDGALGCWVWVGAGKPNDYGKFMFHSRPEQAHRASWRLYVDDIPPGVLILHACDLRRCVNWLHLWPGYGSENTKDMYQKHRSRWNPERQPAKPWSEGNFHAWAARRMYQPEDRMHFAIALQRPDAAHELIDQACDRAGWLRGTHSGDRSRRLAHRSMDIVIERTQSAIEQAFYGMLLVRSINEEGMLVVVDCATASDLLRFRHRVRRLLELREEYALHQGHTHLDFSGFVASIGADLDEIEFLVAYQEDGFQERLHLALHVEHPDGTRVDGLVFHPLDDEPQIAIPCGRLVDVEGIVERLGFALPSGEERFDQ